MRLEMVALNPKLDIVFKMLFAAERNRGSLIALLTDVLQPAVPIESVTLLNSETPRGAMVDKGPVLDLRVRLADGRHVHVEMQRSREPSFRERGLYYWSRVHGAQLLRGQDYTELQPTIGVFILDFVELAEPDLHSVFQLCERRSRRQLTDHLELHYIELPKCQWEGAATDDPVLKWAKFFTAETDAELEQLVMAYPELRESKETLEQLARDRTAKELAELREIEIAMIEGNLRRARDASREEGREQGIEEGRERGIEEGREQGIEEGREQGIEEGREQGIEEGQAAALRRSIERVCVARGVLLDDALRGQIRDGDLPELERLLEDVATRSVGG